MIYFIGIGGIGMSALAGIFNSLGMRVAGSDIQNNIVTQGLEKQGIKVFYKQIAQNIKNISKNNKIKFAVSSVAIPLDHPEILELKRLNVPILTYPQALGILVNLLKTIGIAGTHGKTTTTAIVTQLLTQTGYDPYALIGALFQFLGNKNFRLSS